MSQRIQPTPEDMDIAARNLKRLMLWCGKAGIPVRSQRAVIVAQNFVGDMTHFGPGKKP